MDNFLVAVTLGSVILFFYMLAMLLVPIAAILGAL
jgi:hypothetical protein